MDGPRRRQAMLRSFTILDPHLANSIRENPRYNKMTPEEILGKFVSGQMMIKEARYVDEALNGPIHEPQTIALKATSSRCNTPGVYIPLNNEYGFKHVISVDKTDAKILIIFAYHDFLYRICFV
jgi:hypothetical protein